MKDEVKKRVLDYFYNPSNREHILFDNHISRNIKSRSRLTESSSYNWNRNREDFERLLYSNDLGLEYIMPNIYNFLYKKNGKVEAPEGYRSIFLNQFQVWTTIYDFDFMLNLNDNKFVELPSQDRYESYFFIANNNNYIIRKNEEIIELYNNIDIYLLKSLFINEKMDIKNKDYGVFEGLNKVFYEEFNKIFEKNLILKYRFELLAPKKTEVSLEKNMFGLPSNWIDIFEIPEYEDSIFLSFFHKCKVNKSIVRDLNLFCREEIKGIKDFESHKEIREQKEMEEKFSEDNFS